MEVNTAVNNVRASWCGHRKCSVNVSWRYAEYTFVYLYNGNKVYNIHDNIILLSSYLDCKESKLLVEEEVSNQTGALFQNFS